MYTAPHKPYNIVLRVVFDADSRGDLRFCSIVRRCQCVGPAGKAGGVRAASTVGALYAGRARYVRGLCEAW